MHIENIEDRGSITRLHALVDLDETAPICILPLLSSMVEFNQSCLERSHTVNLALQTSFSRVKDQTTLFESMLTCIKLFAPLKQILQ